MFDRDEGAFHHVVWSVGGTLLGIHQFPDSSAEGEFNERRIGLDHRAELEEWEGKLDDLGVRHGGIVDASYGSGLSLRDPDNNALEVVEKNMGAAG